MSCNVLWCNSENINIESILVKAIFFFKKTFYLKTHDLFRNGTQIFFLNFVLSCSTQVKISKFLEAGFLEFTVSLVLPHLIFEQAFDTSPMLNIVMNNLTSLAMFSLQNSALKQKKNSTDSAAAGVSIPHPTCFAPIEIFCTSATPVSSHSTRVLTTQSQSCFFLLI